MNNRKQRGFTLIELLVVVAIIGILAAIAIPQYATYKKAAVDSKMKSDIHNAATAMEAYYGSNGNSYLGASASSLTSYGYRQSDGITMTAVGDNTSFTLTSAATGGNQASFTFSSSTGKIQ